MKIGFIGLGKMGLNMTKRLLKNHEVVVYDVNEKQMEEAKTHGAIKASSIKDLISQLPDRKVIWIMVPSGDITQKTIEDVSSHLKKEDILIDGGNSYYKDSITRSEDLEKKGIYFLDVGTSGGIWGLKEGYCLMIGGENKAFAYVESIFESLCEKDGYLHVSKSGSGHYVKMVHNGIEYGLMQAYAEGFELLKAKKDFDLDLSSISKLWNTGSVVRSWLLELLESVFQKDQNLKDIKDYVEDSGEGRWTVKEGIDNSIPLPVITYSLIERFSSRQSSSYSNKILAALRNEFGGHGFKKE